MGNLIDFFCHKNFIALNDGLPALDALADLEGVRETLVHVVLLGAIHFNRLKIKLVQDAKVFRGT